MQIPYSVAESIGKKYKHKQVIILAVNPGQFKCWVTTWGSTKVLCKATEVLSKFMYEGFLNRCKKLHKITPDELNKYKPVHEIENCPECGYKGKLF